MLKYLNLEGVCELRSSYRRTKIKQFKVLKSILYALMDGIFIIN